MISQLNKMRNYLNSSCWFTWIFQALLRKRQLRTFVLLFKLLCHFNHVTQAKIRKRKKEGNGRIDKMKPCLKSSLQTRYSPLHKHKTTPHTNSLGLILRSYAPAKILENYTRKETLLKPNKCSSPLDEFCFANYSCVGEKKTATEFPVYNFTVIYGWLFNLALSVF